MDKAEAWRRRASKLREAARVERDRLEQCTLLLLADDCDEIARQQQAKDEAA